MFKILFTFEIICRFTQLHLKRMQSKVNCLEVSLPSAHSALLQTFEALRRLEAAVGAFSLSQPASAQFDRSSSPPSVLEDQSGVMVTRARYYAIIQTSIL